MPTAKKALDVVSNEGFMALVHRTSPWIKRWVLFKRAGVRKWLYSHIDLDQNIQVETPVGAIELEADPAWYRFHTMQSGGEYEPVLMNALANSLTEDDVFYNVGARWGIFSLFAERCGVESQNIHNFEANESNLEILMRNVGDTMNICRGFVWDKSDGNHIKLDDYMKSHESPTIIKMDIEGAEMRALAGARQILSLYKPELFIEVHNSIKKFDNTKEEVVQILLEHGYTIRVADHRLDGSPWSTVSGGNLPTSSTFLIHAVPE
jgi:hypothetical protein